MITCHRKYLEERCLERGFALAAAMPCVVSQDGDMWTINVDHDSYPRGIRALSFKCVEDCTTPQFVCLPGYCCTENIFDGTNSCLPCSSSSSSSSSSSESSSSSSSECTCDPATGSNPPGCDSECLERFQCEVGSAPDFSDGGCKSVGYYTDAEAPSGSGVKTDCDTNCLLRYNHCCIDSTAQSNGDTSPWACDYQNPQHAIGFYDAPGIPTAPDPNCGLRYICGTQNGCCELGYFTASSGINNGSCDTDGVMVSGCDGSCKAIWSCDPTNGPTFLRYSVDSPGSGEYDDTTIQDCVDRWTNCEVATGSTHVGYSTDTSLPTSQVSDCVERYYCEGNGNCDNLGYHTDSTAPAGSTNYDTCTNTCVLRNTGCSSQLQGCSETYTTDSATYPYEGSCDPTCHERYVCNSTPNEYGQFCFYIGHQTNSTAPSGSILSCNECVPRWTYCEVATGSTHVGYSTDTSLPTSKISDCLERSECNSTDPNASAGCNNLGFYTDSTAPSGSILSTQCDGTTCFKIYSCDYGSGATFLRWGTSLGSGEYDEAGIQNCIMRNTGCIPGGAEGYSPSPSYTPCVQGYLVDGSLGPVHVHGYEGSCPNCYQIWGCDPANGPTFLRFDANPPGVDEYDNTTIQNCVDRWTNCEVAIGSTPVGYSTNTSLPTSQIADCIERYECWVGTGPDYTDGGCYNLGYYVDSEAPSDSMDYSTCTSDCVERYDCNSSDPNASTGCQNLGYYTDSTAPSGSTLSTQCDGTTCFKIYSCDPTNGSTFVRWGTSLGPDEYDDTTIQDCIQRNTGCVANGLNNQGASDPEPCKSIYTTDTTTYPNAGACGSCYEIYTCDQQSGGQFARWVSDTSYYQPYEYLPSYGSCEQYANCDPQSGCSDLGYNTGSTLPYWAYHYAKGTCSDGNCALRNTGCVNSGIMDAYLGLIGCRELYSRINNAYYHDYYGNYYDLSELGACDQSCVQRSECNSTDPSSSTGCSNLGYYTDSAAPSGSYKTTECNGTTCFKIYSCNSTNGPTFTRWGTSLGPDEYDDAGIQSCIVRNTGCISTGCTSEYSTNTITHPETGACKACPSSSSSSSSAPSSSSSAPCSIPIYSRMRVWNCASQSGGGGTLTGFSMQVTVTDPVTNQVVLTGTVPSGSGEYTYLGVANLSSNSFSVTNTPTCCTGPISTSYTGTCGTDRFIGALFWLNGGC